MLGLALLGGNWSWEVTYSLIAMRMKSQLDFYKFFREITFSASIYLEVGFVSLISGRRKGELSFPLPLLLY